MKLKHRPSAGRCWRVLGLQAIGAHAIDLVGAYEQALRYDPAKLAADEALAAGREKAVQGDALLRPRIGLQAGVSYIDARSSATVPAALASIAPSDSNGTTRQAGRAAHAAAVRRDGARRQAAAAPADRARPDAVRPVAAGPGAARRRSLFRRAAGRGDAARRRGGEGRDRDAARSRAGPLRRRPGQGHRPAGSAGALRPGPDQGDLRAQLARPAARAVPGDDRPAGAGLWRRWPPGLRRACRSPTACGLAGQGRGSEHARQGQALASSRSPAPRSASTSSPAVRP